MTVVVADTSPINYLILIDQIEVLSRLYGQVVIPASHPSGLQVPLREPAS